MLSAIEEFLCSLLQKFSGTDPGMMVSSGLPGRSVTFSKTYALPKKKDNFSAIIAFFWGEECEGQLTLDQRSFIL